MIAVSMRLEVLERLGDPTSCCDKRTHTCWYYTHHYRDRWAAVAVAAEAEASQFLLKSLCNVLLSFVDRHSNLSTANQFILIILKKIISLSVVPACVRCAAVPWLLCGFQLFYKKMKKLKKLE
jgi:hypothetical protein